MIAVAWLLAGIAALIGGSELLTRGGTRVAVRLGISPLIIGLTIVALGTSTPELAVGIDSSLQGKGAIAIGNITGANIFNILFILGLSALIDPLTLKLQTLRFDLPCMLAAALILLALSRDGALSRANGAILISFGFFYTIAVAYLARLENRHAHAEFIKEFGLEAKRQNFTAASTAASVISLFCGIVIVVLGADWFVDGAVNLARMLKVSDTFIGLTVVTLGTSAPELVTTIVGSLRKERDIAVGNLLGSSVYNVFAILGTTCAISPIPVPVSPNVIHIDLPLMAAVAIFCIPVFTTGRRVTRLEGAAFVALYLAYLAYLVLFRT